ncbi:uncharacterized protein B0I36DRAFT_356177 [Microdochium trichocladiopsis]|uniref:Uncharacterized protein n=1 Tax=Microdochium trichocladiopsis TaxID=1682393 RepID=A0A9P9BHL5_9PEZI|nr:uncharacterized protein B0I36DRAFT_356177 [Microdochium trichocladiopsis]KAH7012079.1 hypothetical protein B0I36DRAFT_356177 [Microdochium trichocladiopsis]
MASVDMARQSEAECLTSLLNGSGPVGGPLLKSTGLKYYRQIATLPELLPTIRTFLGKVVNEAPLGQRDSGSGNPHKASPQCEFFHGAVKINIPSVRSFMGLSRLSAATKIVLVGLKYYLQFATLRERLTAITTFLGCYDPRTSSYNQDIPRLSAATKTVSVELGYYLQVVRSRERLTTIRTFLVSDVRLGMRACHSLLFLRQDRDSRGLGPLLHLPSWLLFGADTNFVFGLCAPPTTSANVVFWSVGMTRHSELIFGFLRLASGIIATSSFRNTATNPSRTTTLDNILSRRRSWHRPAMRDSSPLAGWIRLEEPEEKWWQAPSIIAPHDPQPLPFRQSRHGVAAAGLSLVAFRISDERTGINDWYLSVPDGFHPAHHAVRKGRSSDSSGVSGGSGGGVPFKVRSASQDAPA